MNEGGGGGYANSSSESTKNRKINHVLLKLTIIVKIEPTIDIMSIASRCQFQTSIPNPTKPPSQTK